MGTEVTESNRKRQHDFWTNKNTCTSIPKRHNVNGNNEAVS